MSSNSRLTALIASVPEATATSMARPKSVASLLQSQFVDTPHSHDQRPSSFQGSVQHLDLAKNKVTTNARRAVANEFRSTG
ncbi:hypothetical protein OPT61_g835 [Boeremia exigua]|uniref:Uncharacterized protein n=1 Tax=Boeremia exigua TaxID=749465 RepID=A0ACC2ISN7_9PLEO|nr:hypothetical protein OPT61_g835 [Boeremia exigua]